MSEYEFANHIESLANKNKQYRSFIGMGYYPSAVPAVIVRNVFQNPAWYTSYTPYQAEISQGRLEALLNFQTVLTSMTGMEIASSSLLDEGTAAAEAMSMMYDLRSSVAKKEGRNVLFVDENIFPQTLDVLITRTEPQVIEIVIDNYASYEFSGREFGAVLQYPAANGEVCDYKEFTERAHGKEVLVTVVADLMSLAMLAAPGEWVPMWWWGMYSALDCLWASEVLTRDIWRRATHTNAPCRGVSSEYRWIDRGIKR